MPLGLVNFIWRVSQGALLSVAGIVSSGLHAINRHPPITESEFLATASFQLFFYRTL